MVARQGPPETARMSRTRSLSPWLPRIAATLVTGLLATPLAAAIGSTVLWLAASHETAEASVLLLAAFVFYGTLFGSLIAAPVTLAALPVASVLLHARPRLRHWLLPPLGLLLGAWRNGEASDPLLYASTLAFLFNPMMLAGMAGGLLAGALFAWLPPLFSPRRFQR